MSAPITIVTGQGARVDLVMAAGATNRWRLRYSTLDGIVKQPVDLTGWTARAQVRRSTATALAWLTLSSLPADGITIDAPAGLVTLTVDPLETNTDDWQGREGVWDVELTDPAGERYRLAYGTVRFTAQVTR